MLMFIFHIAFALGLMALTLGLFLKHCCRCCQAKCETGDMKACGTKKCNCWVGLTIAILALLSLICTVSAGYKHWKAGDFEMPATMSTSETIQMK